MKKIILRCSQIFIMWVLAIIPGINYAQGTQEINTNLNVDTGGGIGDVANQFVAGPLEGIKHFMSGICYIVGIVLLLVAYHKFQLFRRNSSEMPLSHVIMYFVAGIIIILLPLSYYLVKMTGST